MKVLKPQTIVPESLYVERGADKQLAQIIEQMGRPGYVLVSRQMGKTNLLLHAKRRMQGTSDLFVYLDASNSFPDAKSFFRNIVDVILETSHGIYDTELIPRILARRTCGDFQPHKEHEWELREIIRSISGKLIIFIDEIDALSNSIYSDVIFSFIRSVFFSGRANWTEFTRLNYVLSGVAEPSEIIKNKAVSPFNIGERIYLNDFIREEFDEFIDKTGLQFPRAVAERIFHWANGNPRLSWDICSGVEDLILSGIEIGPALVDNVVRDTYLGSVSLPPIDHIKILVEDNSDLCDALIAIHYGKSDGFSDKLRTRLYLAGISSYNAETRIVSVKNRILAEALSEDYLLSLRHTTVLDTARSYFAAGRYGHAEKELTAYFTNGNNLTNVDEAHYMQGVCFFKDGESSRSLDTFALIGDGLPEEYRNALHYFTAMANMDEKRYAEAIVHYRKILDKGLIDSDAVYFYDAAVQLSKVLSVLNQSNPQEISSLSEIVINSEADIIRLIPDVIQRDGILMAAHMNLAHFKHSRGKSEEAIHLAILAATWARGYNKLGPILLQYKLMRSGERRDELLDLCVSTFLTEVSTRHLSDGDELPFELLHELMENLDDKKRMEEIQELIKNLLCSITEFDIESVVMQLISNVVVRPRKQLSRVLIATILDALGEKLSFEIRRYLVIIPVLVDPIDTGGASHEAHLALIFASEPHIFPVDLECYAVFKVIMADVKHRNLDRAECLLAVLKRSRISNPVSGAVSAANQLALLADYLLCLIEVRRSKFTPGAYIRPLLDRIAKLHYFDLPGFPSNFLRSMRLNLITAVAMGRPLPFKRASPKPGRNEVVTVQYESGLKSGKYKIFATDLNKGLCSLSSSRSDVEI